MTRESYVVSKNGLTHRVIRLYHTHGLRKTLKAVWLSFIWRIFDPILLRRMKLDEPFTFNGRQYRYNRSMYERAIELPIIINIIQEEFKDRKINMLEVGNVLSDPKYELPSGIIIPAHDIVDKYEKRPGVISKDIMDYWPEGKMYDLIVSISTIEHIGFDDDDRNPDKIPQTIERLKAMLAPGGKFVFTVPTGYNPDLDSKVLFDDNSDLQRYFMKRISKDNKWVQITDRKEAANYSYGSKYRLWAANCLAICMFTKPPTPAS
jgi:hypothetical protein